MSQENSQATVSESVHSAQAGGTLDIQRVYTKEQSCKVPHAPGIFQQTQSAEVKPDTALELSIQKQPLENGLFEVTLKFHVTMKLAQQTAMIIEVQQAGLFKLGSFDAKHQAFLLGAYCPGVLFPYARKTISDLASSAGFLPIILPPINFDALYQQREQKVQDSGAPKQSGGDAFVVNEKIPLQ